MKSSKIDVIRGFRRLDSSTISYSHLNVHGVSHDRVPPNASKAPPS